jgi:hypothetical protein
MAMRIPPRRGGGVERRQPQSVRTPNTKRQAPARMYR